MDDDEIGVLLKLVEEYEDKHNPIEFPDPISSMEFHLEQQGLTSDDMASCIGSPAEVKAVLSKRFFLNLHLKIPYRKKASEYAYN